MWKLEQSMLFWFRACNKNELNVQWFTIRNSSAAKRSCGHATVHLPLITEWKSPTDPNNHNTHKNVRLYCAYEWNVVRRSIYVLDYSPAASIQINIFTINQITELTSNSPILFIHSVCKVEHAVAFYEQFFFALRCGSWMCATPNITCNDE